MKSIADIKRKMIVGSFWHTMWQCRGNYKDMGRRTVAKVQSNCFGFKIIKAGGSEAVSWCDWPKLSEVTFNSEKSFTIKHGDIELTYTLISEA